MIIQDIQIVTTDARKEYFLSLGWEAFTSQWDALAILDFNHELEVDTETTGLRSYMVEKLWCIQIGISGKQFIFDLDEGGLNPKVLKKLLESKMLYFHNAAYDLPYLYKLGIVPKPGLIFDTQVAENTMTMGLKPPPKRTLAACVKRYLNVDIDKSQQATINQGLINKEAIIYSGTDVMYLRALADAQRARIAVLGLQERLKLENLFVSNIAYLEFSGVHMDQERLYWYIREAEARELAALHKMRTYADIKWSSAKQVLPILAEYGIKELNKKTGRDTTEIEGLLRHLDKPIAVDLVEYVEARKAVTTYGRRWLHFFQSDKRIHTRFKQFTSAGRTSCGGLAKRKGDLGKKFNDRDTNYIEYRPFPNLQQIPRPDEDFPERLSLRTCFIPKKGNKFVKCDYSSQESVIMADQSKDPAMLEFFKSGGGDMHAYTARLAHDYMKDLTDKEIQKQYKGIRYEIKRANFAIAYGGNGTTIANNINVSVAKGEEIYNSIMAVFVTLPEFFKSRYQFVLNYGYMPIDTVGGKRMISRIKEFQEKVNDKRYWDKYYAEKKLNSDWYKAEVIKNKVHQGMRSSLRKESVNSLIQGIGAFMSKLAGVYILDYIIKHDLFGKVLTPIFVHDEWCTEQSEALTPMMMKVVHDSMVLAGKRCLTELTIGADAEAKDRWVDLPEQKAA